MQFWIERLEKKKINDKAKDMGWGYFLDNGFHIALVLFADNFWLVSQKPQQLSAMMSFWLEDLRSLGWSVPLDACSWATTELDEIKLSNVEVEGCVLER